MTDRRIACFCANAQRPSRTRGLVERIAVQAGNALSASVEVFDLFEIGESLRAASFRTALAGPAKQALAAIERADALIVGASVTRARSYPGLMMHLFDLADPARLRGKPVVIVATGGPAAPPRLMTLQLRILFKALGARPVPTIVYASKAALRGPSVDPALRDRIALASAELATVVIAQSDGHLPGESDLPTALPTAATDLAGRPQLRLVR